MQINRTTFVLALVLLGLLPSMAQAQSWYAPSGWLYRKAITINHLQVGTGPHTNYPVLISRADTDLQARALANGNDILFTSADGTTKLAHEIESYTSASGTLVAWVQIPSLSSAVDTVIYMYYGNAGAASQQNVTGTWDANFRGVYHLNGVFTDSTSNAANGTNTGTVSATGMISGGRGFVRSDGTDFITITGLLGSPPSATLSVWATLTTRDPAGAELISLGDHLGLDVDQTSLGGLGYAYFGGATWTGTPSNVHYSGAGWHHLFYTFDDAGDVQRFFVDGVELGTTTITGSINYTGLGTNTVIGKHANANTNYDFDGTADEVRISNVVRSGGWALTEFNNQGSPSTFYSVGTEAKTYYSLANGNWNAAATWSNTGHSGAAAATAPGSADYVVIGNSDIVTLTANATNNTDIGINSTGTLNLGTNTISGTGPFSVNSGGNLGIGSTAGIASSGATGNVQVTGARTFSAGANYTYNGTAAQVTGNGLPATVNNLTINNAAGVTLSASVAVTSDLTVTSGVFTVGAFSLAVTGTTTVASTLTITSATGAKSFGNLTINGTFTNTAANAPITIAGNLQNNSTFSQGTGRVTFNGATSNTVSGAAATTAFGGGITLNKGISNANVLDVQSVITMSVGGLTLTNGTFKLSSASTITPFTADITASPYLIPSTAGLWCNGGTMNSPAGGMSWTIHGLVRVSAGTINAGAVTGNFFAPFAGASIIIEGGNLVMADRLSLLGSVWTLNMTGGTLTVANAGSNTADRPPFNMDQAGCSFSMSGGTIIIARPGGSAGQNLGYLNLATSGTGFTGGTLQIGNGSTPAASTIGITSTNAIYNLTVNATASTAQLQTSALTVTNTVTISAGTLSANNLNLTIGGDWINNVSTAAFTAGTGTVTFNGTAVGGSIGGSFATTFNSLAVNRANGLSLGANTTAGGTITFTSGNITTGANTLYNSTGTVVHTSGHVIGNFKKNVAIGTPSNETFEIGDATNYTPVTVAFANVTVTGDLTASTAAGDHANIGSSTISPSKSVNRNWTLTNSGISFTTTYGATFTFLAGDIDVGATTSAFIVGKYSGGWTYPTVGSKTGTTTQATGLNTFGDFQLGEFAANYSVSGTVFEDKNYGGGAGRSLAASSGSARAAARVELFNSGGTYQTFATTDGSGNYSFSGLGAGTYTVRVTNASVTSSRGVLAGTTPTQTFRTNASSGTAVAVTDHVGGETPGLLDAIDGSTTLAALTTGTTTPQSITSAVLSSGNISGVDFGYSFNVVVNTNNSGQGSLRRVLVFANAMSNTGLAQSGLPAGIDNAVFMLADGTARPGLTASYATQFAGGVATIALASSLATISDPLVIDATLQPGYTGVPIIELNGAGAGAGVTGLTITAGGSTVRGLVINRFTVDGLSLSTVGNNTIAANYMGTNAGGTVASANTNAGIKVSSSGNTIGGTTAAARNIVSGNGSIGIDITGSSNIVQGNYIGVNSAGTAALANVFGVYVNGGATSNTIGGTAAGAGNVISGNANTGLLISASTSNTVQGNYIGINAAGAAALANGSMGLYIAAAANNNTIGGTSAGARNVISGNTTTGVDIDSSTGIIFQGNYVGVNAAGTAILANGTTGFYLHNGANNTVVGGTAAGAGNVISGNTIFGIAITNSTGANFQGNFVGTNPAGTSALANGSGFYLFGNASSNTIGGTTAAARNIISGNVAYGLYFESGSNSNIVKGNYIGVNAAGTAALANSTGINILNGAINNVVGGTAAGTGNVISGNTNYGVALGGATTTGNLVQGNYLGTNAAGTAALANHDGVYMINGANNNTVGGTAAGAANLISGNSFSGIYITGTSSNNNTVQGNYIGTNAAGTAALGNNIVGVYLLSGASNNTIGGTTVAARNIISGNSLYGIVIQFAGTTGNTVQGNYIGLNAAGTAAVANASMGMYIGGGANNNTVGGTASGAGNFISGNTSYGIELDGASGTSIFGNFIGTNAAGTAAVANGLVGVYVVNGTTNNTIGGTAAGAGNVNVVPIN